MLAIVKVLTFHMDKCCDDCVGIGTRVVSYPGYEMRSTLLRRKFMQLQNNLNGLNHFDIRIVKHLCCRVGRLIGRNLDLMYNFFNMIHVWCFCNLTAKIWCFWCVENSYYTQTDSGSGCLSITRKGLPPCICHDWSERGRVDLLV